MDDQRDPRDLRFEEGMGALEELVSRLESGDLTVEEALRAFEEGVGLVRLLNEKLNEAERRIEVVSRGADGTVSLRIVDEEEP